MIQAVYVGEQLRETPQSFQVQQVIVVLANKLTQLRMLELLI